MADEIKNEEPLTEEKKTDEINIDDYAPKDEDRKEASFFFRKFRTKESRILAVLIACVAVVVVLTLIALATVDRSQLLSKQTEAVETDESGMEINNNTEHTQIGISKDTSVTINLNKTTLFNNSVYLHADRTFTGATDILGVKMPATMANIRTDEIPTELDIIARTDGSHNGSNYAAYTFYIRNNSAVETAYSAKIKINGATKGIEKAIRVRFYNFDVMTTYAKAKSDGTAETGTVPFKDDSVIAEIPQTFIAAQKYDRYTLVVWLDSDDTDLEESMAGGTVQLSMDFE